MIRKLASGKYRLHSRNKNPKTGRRRNLGTFSTRTAAEKHERGVQLYQRHWRTSQQRQKSACLLVKVDEINNCESDYHRYQAETEDVTDIVPGDARTSAFSILLVGTGTSISLFIFRC
jgi:hypothetical protein